jgi:hypothetical protein
MLWCKQQHWEDRRVTAVLAQIAVVKPPLCS